MRTRLATVGVAVLLATAGSTTLVSSYAAAAPVHVTGQQKITCTKTSSGTCIRGGGFCPQASFGRAGYDAVGRRYTCKGDHTHPHWMK